MGPELPSGASVSSGTAATAPPAASPSPRPAPAISTELDQLKGQFLASLNHELRTPLSGVLGMTDLLLETKLDLEQQEYVSTVRECAAQLLEILNSVLDYSSLSAGNFRMEDSEFLLRSLLDSIALEATERAAPKQLEVRARWDERLPETAIGDERYIRQLLLHLVRNAVKFTHRGRIDLNATVESAAASRMWLRIEVADSGIGIPPEKLKLIFESFRQLDSGLARNYNGLGLGLALTEKIVRLMHGHITVESTPNHGSTFTVILPLRLPAGTVVAGPARAGGNGAGGQAKRILVVEDNRIAQQIVGHVLQRAQYEVAFAATGEEGVEAARQSRFDLVLMDLQMPGIDGLAATRMIREIAGYEEVPILALSANYSDEHRLLCHQLGMQGFLPKPIQKEELLRTVDLHLRRE